MISRARCPVRSTATARRCTLNGGHASNHERRSRSGRLLEEWPRTASDVDHAKACTSAELVEHLDDLIDLAKFEGFGLIVGALQQARRVIVGGVYRSGKRRRARPDPVFGWSRGPQRNPSRR